MTLIKSLTCKGFKSFAKRTEIPLLEGYNCVIGSNGSGKSNLSDAICFVLGKMSAKGLRAEKSANLIFHGGKKGSPAKEAEVSIVFDNNKKIFPTDAKDVEIKRTVKKTGQSTYRINGKVHSRQQVVDLLAHAKINPDGHNIVLQGDIIRFTDMKTVERREIIEDIAGISMFEDKKHKSMNELNKVQEKLNEADIILTEREKTLQDLKKDRDQALNYKRFEKDIKRNKATRVNLVLKDKSSKLDEVKKKFDSYETEISKFNKEIDSIKAEINEKKKRITDINHELRDKGDKRQRELAKEIEGIKTEVIKSNSRKDVLENELRKLKERKFSLIKDVKELGRNVEKFAKEKEILTKENKILISKENVLESDISNYKKDNGIEDKEDLSKGVEELEVRIDDKQRQLHDADNKRMELLREKDKLSFKVDDASERLKKIKDQNKEEVVKLKKNRDEFVEVTKKLSQSLNESSVFAVQLSTAREKLMDSGDEMAKLKARSIGIREMNAGDRGVQKIKSMNLEGVHGTVAELAEVPSEYAMALEVAAGSRIRSVVVSSDLVGSQCIKALKESKQGVATFLPLNKLRERKIDRAFLKRPGVHGLAMDLVKHQTKFKKVFNYVFGGTVVVDDLSVARKLGIGSVRMVTLDGDVVEVSGAMVGGHRRKTGYGFKEKEVNSGMVRLEKDIVRLEDTVNLLEKKKMDNDREIISLRERKAVLEAEIKVSKVSEEELDGLEGSKKDSSGRLKEVSKELNDFEQDVGDINIEMEQLKKDRQELREKLIKVTSSEFNNELEKFENKRIGVKENIIKNESEIGALGNQIALYDKEKDKAETILKGNEKDFVDFTEELEQLKADLSSNKEVLKLKEQNQRKFYAEYKGMFNERTKMEKGVTRLDGSFVRNQERVRSVEGRKNDVSIRKAVLAGEVEGLNKEMEQYEGVQFRRGVGLDQLNVEIRNFENSLRSMGNVNLRALEIYENVHEEYQKLLDRYEQLKVEKEDVLGLIYEIDSKKKDCFMKTFKLLERNFKEIFSTLTKVGEAELVIENPDDIFDGGIGVRVKISGSKYVDMKSLSGGEKSLTALSFIFAIQEFEPSWFYLLDEVDAALDKRNSELLSKLIAKYSNGSQYLVISHNDAVISEANAIYGMSMQNGVSKVVSLKI